MNELEALIKMADKMASTYNWFRTRGEEDKSVFTSISLTVLAMHTSPVEKRYRLIRDRFISDMEHLMGNSTDDLDESTISFINDYCARLRANDGVFQVNEPASA